MRGQFVAYLLEGARERRDPRIGTQRSRASHLGVLVMAAHQGTISFRLRASSLLRLLRHFSPVVFRMADVQACGSVAHNQSRLHVGSDAVDRDSVIVVLHCCVDRYLDRPTFQRRGWSFGQSFFRLQGCHDHSSHRKLTFPLFHYHSLRAIK